VNTRFIAWLVGVDVSAVLAYREVADWPSHWVARAQHRIDALGVTSEHEAMELYKTRLSMGN
jgi:hypothetical protein